MDDGYQKVRKIQSLGEWLHTIEEDRRESGNVMDALFRDEKFLTTLRERLRELKP